MSERRTLTGSPLSTVMVTRIGGEDEPPRAGAAAGASLAPSPAPPAAFAPASASFAFAFVFAFAAAPSRSPGAPRSSSRACAAVSVDGVAIRRVPRESSTLIVGE